MADPLQTPAVDTLTNIPPDRYERIQQALEEELGETLTGNSGVVKGPHGVRVGYIYDGVSVLTLTVIQPPTLFGHELMSPQDVIEKVSNAVNGVQ